MMASHERSATVSYEELCQIYSKDIIDQATRPTHGDDPEDDEEANVEPVNPPAAEESVLLQLTYSVWLSNPPATEATHGPRSGRRSYLWHEHNGPPTRPLYICIPPAAREWSWGGFQRGVIKSLVSHNMEVAHEIRCNHAAGELVWQMYVGSNARPTTATSPLLITARSWPASVRRILRSPRRFRLHILAPDGPWLLDPDPSITRQPTPPADVGPGRLDWTYLHCPTPSTGPRDPPIQPRAPLPGEILVPIQVYVDYTLYVPIGRDPHGVIYTQIYEGKDHPSAPMTLLLQGLTPAKLTRLVFFHLSRERRSIHVDRVAQDADDSKSLQWHFTIIEPGQPPALGSFMRGEGCFEDFVLAAGASSPKAKVVIRLYMQYDDRHIRPLPHKERRYQVIGPRSPRADTTSRPQGSA
ncbi:hypothetical protein PGTUg99_010591 [Puccinia graminis f. sp. tritici]|uniref:Uncharacterized protein n=1 Tax=Puccinia graminis f. sp. tritici TaxID=56615 RepID=A0A5B0Q8I9_PUCGR|nr:hypothetical protein PGTUg99_010591 [Puccinia graminis f. sp. tritici]